MEHLIEVAFKGNRKEFFYWAFEAPPPVRAAIIVDAERGEDLGRVNATGDLAQLRKNGTTHGKEQREPLRHALRLATSEDVQKSEALRADDETARRIAVAKARTLSLQMKVSDAEWQWDRRRLTFYFTAEERVDFRLLVRQLESYFGVRVQMWHIGPRDEAKRLDGVGHCGRQLCSAAWLPELLPVKTSLAKEQRLSTITPTQISGACGRLMCCLRYEHEFYVAARKRFPKQGKIVKTLEGEERVEATDIFRDLVTLKNPAGESRVIPLAQFRRELAGEAIPVEEEVREPDDDASDDGEEHPSPRRAEVTPLQRAPRDGSRPDPRRDARPPREEQRPPRNEARSEARGNERSEQRRDARDNRGPREARPDHRAPRPPSPQSAAAPAAPASEARNSGAPSRADQPRADQPREARQPSPQRPTASPRDAATGAGAPNARPDASASDAEHDNEQRRGRRRRGRRGGRRHRGDGPHGNNGGAPDAPPSNLDS